MTNIQAVGNFKIKELIKFLQEYSSKNEEECGLIHYVDTEFERIFHHHVDIILGKTFFEIQMKFRQNRDCSTPGIEES